MTTDAPSTPSPGRFRSFFTRSAASGAHGGGSAANEKAEDREGRPTKWGMGILNDKLTNEVPGSVILLSGERNQPLGLRNAPARTSASSIPQRISNSADIRRESRQNTGTKTTPDGRIILNPQPDDSDNDPLNWPSWRRDCSLLSLGLFCMMGGGMTPILAAGFSNVSATYGVSVPRVALTTGFFMMGLGVGSVIASPTAILFGKRPVYLLGIIMFIITSVWCAVSPNYTSLVAARVFQGISVSPVECLPSATIAEIFFLHERAYRIGIYTLLLLGGKNLIPLMSAAIIQSLSWRWVFWIVALCVAFVGSLVFVFVPETFWDRSPVPRTARSRNTSKHSFSNRKRLRSSSRNQDKQLDGHIEEKPLTDGSTENSSSNLASPQMSEPPQDPTPDMHVEFAGDMTRDVEKQTFGLAQDDTPFPFNSPRANHLGPLGSPEIGETRDAGSLGPAHEYGEYVAPRGGAPPTPALHNLNSPFYETVQRNNTDYFSSPPPGPPKDTASDSNGGGSAVNKEETPNPSNRVSTEGNVTFPPLVRPRHSVYTNNLRHAPRRTVVQQLRPWNGRLNPDNWLRVAIRPFILFSYPAVLWSAGVYACSVGWLIVLSESVTVVYRSKNTYNFGALHAGLIYVSPFIGGVLGTAVAGKVSDVIVRAISRRNGGLYEPEFRLVMAIPVALTTVIGLMGFGWSAQIRDSWIVPTLFFGVISFGCCLGSTTAITFCVDSYRQYAGEALVTLNFSKNIFHGLVFSLFFTNWLEADGSKMVFIWVGVIQMVLLAFTVPMYIFGKRARMWTVRKNFMEHF